MKLLNGITKYNKKLVKLLSNYYITREIRKDSDLNGSEKSIFIFM